MKKLTLSEARKKLVEAQKKYDDVKKKRPARTDKAVKAHHENCASALAEKRFYRDAIGKLIRGQQVEDIDTNAAAVVKKDKE